MHTTWQFNGKPDYNYLHKLFRKLLTCEGHQYGHPFPNGIISKTPCVRTRVGERFWRRKLRWCSACFSSSFWLTHLIHLISRLGSSTHYHSLTTTGASPCPHAQVELLSHFHQASPGIVLLWSYSYKPFWMSYITSFMPLLYGVYKWLTLHSLGSLSQHGLDYMYR